MSTKDKLTTSLKESNLDKQASVPNAPAVRPGGPVQTQPATGAPAATLSLPTNFWIGCHGAWHLQQSIGTGIYEFGGEFWHTTWTFVNSDPVNTPSGSTLEGWKYKEDGYNFYMFFSNFAGQGDCSGDQPFQLLFSYDGEHFEHFDCTI